MKARPLTRTMASVLVAASTVLAWTGPAAEAQQPARKPNILVIFGDDVGHANVSAFSMGVMGYRTPNIDRIAREGQLQHRPVLEALKQSGGGR